jgi:hypothetical protein
MERGAADLGLPGLREQRRREKRDRIYRRIFRVAMWTLLISAVFIAGYNTRLNMNTQVENLAEALPREMARARELLTRYQAIGPSGTFGTYVINAALSRAEKAACSHDTVAMLRAYTELKELE